MYCILLLTHDFKPEFINTLIKIDTDPNITNYKVVVLFDKNNEYPCELDNKFLNIDIVKINRIDTSYDNLGHSMYINYFKQNYESITNYKYIWIIENDVYFPNSLIAFINSHNSYNYDLLVSEYGTRSINWCWTSSLRGFKHVYNIGVLAVIMRFSPKFLLTLIDNIDKNYFGYLEAIIPHICIENNFSIQQFLPEMCGILTTDHNLPLLNLIRNDIQNNTRFYIENKIYHPIKL